MPFRIGNIEFHKNECYHCHKLFIPEFCKVCSYREYGLCEQCHKKTNHHKLGVKHYV